MRRQLLRHQLLRHQLLSRQPPHRSEHALRRRIPTRSALLISRVTLPWTCRRPRRPRSGLGMRLGAAGRGRGRWRGAGPTIASLRILSLRDPPGADPPLSASRLLRTKGRALRRWVAGAHLDVVVRAALLIHTSSLSTASGMRSRGYSTPIQSSSTAAVPPVSMLAAHSCSALPPRATRQVLQVLHNNTCLPPSHTHTTSPSVTRAFWFHSSRAHLDACRTRLSVVTRGCLLSHAVVCCLMRLSVVTLGCLLSHSVVSFHMQDLSIPPGARRLLIVEGRGHGFDGWAWADCCGDSTGGGTLGDRAAARGRALGGCADDRGGTG